MPSDIHPPPPSSEITENPDQDALGRYIALVECIEWHRENRGLFTPDHLKWIRTAFGLSQAGFAAMLGVARNQVYMFESGRREPQGAVLRLYGLFENAITSAVHQEGERIVGRTRTPPELPPAK